MIRPANLFMLAAWSVAVIVIAVRHRSRPLRLIAVTSVAACALLPMIPQSINNSIHHGSRTPLIVLDLGKMQQLWGIQNLKYATAMPPVPAASIRYANPFSSATAIDERAPWRWYLDHPGRGAITLALHVFNLTDQDLLFTYSRDLDPWYRIPLGVINHAAVALGLAGLWLVLRTVRAGGDPFGRDAVVALLLLLLAHLSVYSWTAVEMRFGSVLLLCLFPLAAYTLLRLAPSAHTRWTALGGVALYVAAALLLSGWVRNQSELIRAAASG